jgi:hypothetical protein
MPPVFLFGFGCPRQRGSAGGDAEKEVAMKFLLVVMLIRFVVALFTRSNAANEEENENKSIEVHPAGFELRDHFDMRCAE